MASSKTYSLIRCIRQCTKLNYNLEAINSSRLICTTQVGCKSVLYGAICVERHPVVVPDKSKVGKKFSEMLSRVEEENSYLSDHEVRHIKEQKAAKSKQETAEEETSGADAETVTALDLEDKWDAEIKSFVSASKRTEADEKNDEKSLERHLDAPLYLLVKQKVEGTDHWVLPQAAWQSGESLRQTAERALSSVCENVKANVLGNAPCAVAKFEAPAGSEEDNVKIFFYKAWHREGNVITDQGAASDHVWVTKEELNKFCHNSYTRHLKKFIFDF